MELLATAGGDDVLGEHDEILNLFLRIEVGGVDLNKELVLMIGVIIDEGEAAEGRAARRPTTRL